MSNRRQKERQVKTQRVWIKGVLAFGLIATSIAPSEATGYGASFGVGADGPVASAFASASSVASAGLSHLSNAPKDFRINTIDGNPFLPKHSGVSVVLDDSDVGGELSLENGGNKQHKQQLHNILGGILGSVSNLATAAARSNPYYDANIFLAPLRGTQPSNSGAQPSNSGVAGQPNYEAARKPTYAEVAHPNYGLPPSGPATQSHYGPASAAQHPSSAYIPPSSNNCQSGNCNSASLSPSDCIGSNCPQPNHRELPEYPTRKVLPADSPFAPKPNAVYPSHDGCLGSNCPGQTPAAGQAPSLGQPSFGSQAPSDGQASFALQTPSTGQAPTPSVGQSAQENNVNVFEGPSAFGGSYSTPPPSLSTNAETQEIEEREPVTTCLGSNCEQPSRTYVPPPANEGSQQPQPSGQQVPPPNRGYVPPPANQGTPQAAACPSNNCAPPQAAPWHPAMNPNGPAGGAWHPGVNPGSNSDVKVVYVEYPGEGEPGGQPSPAAAGGSGGGGSRVKLTESLQPVPSWLVNGGLGGVGGVLAGDLGLGSGNLANAWTSAQANAHGAAANAGVPVPTADGTRKTSYSSSSSSSYAYANSHAYAWSQTYGT